MVIRKTKINYFIVIMFTLITINFFGFHSSKSDKLFILLNSYDVAIVLLNVWFAYSYFRLKEFREVIHHSPLRYIFYIYLFILFIFITMPFRGAIGPIDAARVGRDFLILPLALLIFGYSHIENFNHRFFNLLKLVAIISSIQIFINAVNPTLINTIFPAADIREGFQLDTQRNVLLTASMLFPHFMAFIYFFKSINEKFLISNILYFLVFISASSLQGFRSYFVALLIVLAVIVLFKLNQKRILKVLIVLPFLFASIFVIDSSIYNRQMTNKVVNTVLELSGDRQGTLQWRYQRDQITMIPMFFEKPWFGWGFIYHNSIYGQQLGLLPSEIGERRFSIYSIDSGYLTLLIQFGIIGFAFLLWLYASMFLGFIRSKQFLSGVPTIVIGSFFILFIALVTHGGFYSDFGLLPFMLTIGQIHSEEQYEH